MASGKYNCSPNLEVAFRPCVSGDLHKKKFFLNCYFLCGSDENFIFPIGRFGEEDSGSAAGREEDGSLP